MITLGRRIERSCLPRFDKELTSFPWDGTYPSSLSPATVRKRFEATASLRSVLCPPNQLNTSLNKPCVQVAAQLPPSQISKLVTADGSTILQANSITCSLLYFLTNHHKHAPQ